jgi:hypothetical protein
MPDCLPSHILDADNNGWRIGEIATDTETSGLFADDGARVSTASIAWLAPIEEGWAEWCARWDNITFGLETVAPGLEVYIASVAWPFDQGIVDKPEGRGKDNTAQASLFGEDANLDLGEWQALLYLLHDHPLIFHNAKFDLEKYRVGVRRWPGVGQELEEETVYDTQNVCDLLWRLQGTSLKPTCARLFGTEWADEAALVKRYLAKSKLPVGRWDLMPWDVIGQYANTDARITLMLKIRQEWEIERNGAGEWLHVDGLDFSDGVGTVVKQIRPTDGVWAKIERRHEFMKVLYRMERRGVPYDEVASTIAGRECRERAAKVSERLPFEPTDAKAKHYFFGEGKTDKGVECLEKVPYAVTDKGAPSLTAEILGRMVDDGIPHADIWAEYNRLDNAASMWYEGYAKRIGTDGRLRTAFRQNGTRSSRLSVERLNLQAIPQDYRLSDHAALAGILTPRQIIANAVAALEGGWRLFELDLAQAELRIGTMFAKCKLMEQMIRDGEDLHTFTTKALFPDIPESDPLFHDKWRQVGKRGNFSLQFGAKGPTFKKMVSKETGIVLGDQQAVRIVRDWNGLYPEFGRAIYRHQRVVEKRQTRHGYAWIDLVNGERRWFQAYEEAHKAFNQRVQANLGQFAIDWTLMTEPFLANNKKLQAKAKRDGIGEPGLLLTVHDSQMLLLPDDEFGQRLAERCAEFGKELWKQMFAGIPGDVDYKKWESVDHAVGSYVG